MSSEETAASDPTTLETRSAPPFSAPPENIPHLSLHRFLCSAFDPLAFRRFLRIVGGNKLLADIPDGLSLESLVDTAIEKLRHHGLLTKRLFVLLREERPYRATEVLGLAKVFDVSVDEKDVGSASDIDDLSLQTPPRLSRASLATAGLVLVAASSLATFGILRKVDPPVVCSESSPDCPDAPVPKCPTCPEVPPVDCAATCPVPECPKPTCPSPKKDEKSPTASGGAASLPEPRIAAGGLKYGRNDLPASQVAAIVNEVRPKLRTILGKLTPCLDKTPIQVPGCPHTSHEWRNSVTTIRVGTNGEISEASGGCSHDRLFGKPFPSGARYPGLWTLTIEWPRPVVSAQPDRVCPAPAPGSR